MTTGLERYGATDVLVNAARVALRRVGDPVDLRRRLSTFHGRALLARESYTEALEEFELALAAVDEGGGDELVRAEVLQERSSALAATGRGEEAIDDGMVVLHARRQHLGEHHPGVARAHQNLARIMLLGGRVKEAEVHLQDALTAIERRDGPTALAAAETLMMLAGAAMEDEPAVGWSGRSARSRSSSITGRGRVNMHSPCAV